jgi:oligopeptide transport system permease protein
LAVLRLIVTRLIQLPVILAILYTLTLALAWAIPGNPLDKPEGRQPPAEVQEAMKRQYNLQSFGAFYFSYLDNATGLKFVREKLTGQMAKEDEAARAAGMAPPPRRVFDLGPSLQYEDWRVSEIIGASLPTSILLGACAMVLALIIGLSAGIVGAVYMGKWPDYLALGLALIGISLPSFVIGTALLIIFPVSLGVGRVASWGRASDIVLPAITLALPFAAYIARLTRMGMLEVLNADYIRTARAKGVRERDVILKHALKNAFLPVLSYLGPATAGAMTGSFVVEKVFNVPGMGQHFVEAVRNKDLFLIIGVVMVFATMLITFNLIVDVLYRWVDPRIEH